MNKLVIGIVNWNTCDMVKECLTSIILQKTRFSFSVIVVDNNSNDSSQVMIEKKFPEVLLLKNANNIGMAAGLNQIIKKCKGDYYLFLHPDTILKENVLQNMIDYLEKNRNVSVAGCKLVYPNGKNFASAHKFPTLKALLLQTIPIPKRIAQKFDLYGVYMQKMDYDKIQEVDIIASACFFVRNDCLNDELFDERFTNWISEWDLCMRIKQKGGKIWYVPNAEVIHFEGQSVVKGKELEYKNHAYVIGDKMFDSLLLFYKKYYPKSIFLLKAMSVAGMIGKSLRYLPMVILPSKSKNAQNRISHYLLSIKHFIAS